MSDPKQSAAGRPDRTMGLARTLQKAGCGTRKAATALVRAGRVHVDGEVVTDPQRPVGPEQTVAVDGRDVDRIGFRYFAFHKPARVVCTPADGPDRRLVDEFLPPDVPGLHAAGRLDAKTTGLLLVSNDTAWNDEVASSGRLEHEYRVQVDAELSDVELGILDAGVHLPNLGRFRPESVRVIEKMKGATVLTMVLKTGKVRQVRRMFDSLRHRVVMMRRIRVGQIRLGDLAAGAMRPLNRAEVQSVRDPAAGHGATRE